MISNMTDMTDMTKINEKQHIQPLDNYILERIEINNNTYYKDNIGFILNCNIQLVGIYIKNKYILFSDVNNMISNIKKTYKSINL